MSLRVRAKPDENPAAAATAVEVTPESPKPSQSSRQRVLSQALTGTATLANLLPTGTLLAFQLLTPVFTNNGSCDGATRAMTTILLVILCASCTLASFTDSVRLPGDGKVYYGFATIKGMWLFDYSGDDDSIPDTRKFRLRFIDWVHAILSALVFAVVALRDRNVVACFYPAPEREIQEVLNIVPIGIGVVCSLLFMAFPTRRHGIGYPVTPAN